MASANVVSDALRAMDSSGAGGNHTNGASDANLIATGQIVPFHGAVQLLQTHINTVSTAIDAHCPIPTEVLLILFPFVIGVVRVLWPILRSALIDYRACRTNSVVRDIVSISAPVYRTSGLPSDRNAFLQNAILMYLSKAVWVRKPIPTSEWRNKSSVLLLIDPFRSRVYERNDSPFCIRDDSSSDNDNDLAFEGVARSVKKLQRLLLVKLPVGSSWVDTQDELGIELTYKRQRINIVSVVGVERTLSLRARGPNAAQRVEAFTQRCLSYFITQIPNLKKSSRSYYELQPAKSSLLGGDGDGNESKLLFKRYPLSDEKNLDTVFFPEKEQIMKFVDDFLFHRGRFAVEGFPYKLGFLLHGPAGSGKTTFVKALAAYTGRHIISVPLNTVETNQQLYDVFLNRTFNCVGESDPQSVQLDDVIFLLDDVDASSPLVCSRQRRRAIKRRKPAKLTAKEMTAAEKELRRRRHHTDAKGADGVTDENLFEVTDDEEEDLEEHIVELQERRTAIPSPGALGFDSFLSALAGGTGKGAAVMGPAGGGDAGSSSASGGGGRLPSSQSFFGLGGGATRNSSAAALDGTSMGGVGGAGGLNLLRDGTGALEGKKSLFSLFESADKLDLSGLLNVLDGVVDTPGRIVVMITNHPERLDPALVRPGRMSTRLRFDFIQFDALARMAGLHFGDCNPSPASQDIMQIMEKMERDVAKDREAVKATARYRAQQRKAGEKLAAELASEDDADATVTTTADGKGDHGQEELTAQKKTLRSTNQDAKSTTARAGEEENNGVAAAPVAGDKPILVPTGVAAARVPRRVLSDHQVGQLRARVAALEAEAEAWKGTDGNGEVHTGAGPCDGQTPQPQPPVGDRSGGNATGQSTAASPYCFYISPSEVEMMCAQTETLEEFMEMLSQVIRGQLKL